MKTKSYFLVTLMVLLVLSVFLWIQSCQKPIESVELYCTEDIIRDLAEADTPDKAKLAINHLIEKTGIGVPDKNSEYGEFIVDDELLSTLTITQANYINGDKNIAIGEYYSSISEAMDQLQFYNNQFLFECTLNESLKDLYNASIIAINDKEKPTNALLLTIISENGKIPNHVIQYDDTQILSPVQNFCYYLWIFNNYTNYSLLKSSLACWLCGVTRGIRDGACENYLPLDMDGYKDCLARSRQIYEDCLEENNCHDQGGSQ